MAQVGVQRAYQRVAMAVAGMANDREMTVLTIQCV